MTAIKVSDKFLVKNQADIDILQSCLSKSMSGTSETVKIYEEKLSSYWNARYAVATSSGSAAILVALKALDVKQGDEVLLTPTCPLCTVYPVLASGAKPVFCDTEVDNFGLDIKDAETAITAKTRAILDIPMWGYPVAADKLRSFADSYGIPLIEDLAHAHSTTLHGRYLSEYAHISCFSTHDRKILSTGEGGFLLTDIGEYHEKSRSYSRFGNLNGVDFGLNYKLSSVQAALGISRLDLLNEQMIKRRSNAEYVITNLTNSAVSEFKIINDSKPNYYFLLLKLHFKDNKHFLDYLDENGIPSDIKRYGCKALYKFPLLKDFYRECPNAENILDTITTIPIHPGITQRDLDQIVTVINRYQG